MVAFKILVLDHGHTSELNSLQPGSPYSGLAALTNRELEVLGLVGRGAENAEIAQDLNLSKRTVETHLRHLYSKLGVSSRMRLLLLAIDCGLVMDADVPSNGRGGVQDAPPRKEMRRRT